MFDELSQCTTRVLADTYSMTDISVEWDVSGSVEHGDVSTSIALRLATKIGKSPRDIAQVICTAIGMLPFVERSELAGPGFVNVWFTVKELLRQAQISVSYSEPMTVRTKEAPVIVEYSQPNIAKPLGAHHLLSTIIGQAIANMHRHAGYHVLTWNYTGDWGTQFGKLAVSYRRWGDDRPVKEYSIDELLNLYVRFHKETEKDISLEGEGRAAFRKLEEGDAELRAFWRDVVSITKSSLSALYDRLHVHFDTDISESFYEGKMQPILEEGVKKGVFTEGEEGALIVEFPEDTHLPPYMVRKSDGATLYATRDLAQMRYRIDIYHPESILICTDRAQELHFRQLIATCQKLQWVLPHFCNVLVGRMRFADATMSTRKGTIIRLERILDEEVGRAMSIIKDRGDLIQTDDPKALAEMMGVGSVVYGIVSQNRNADITFDWEKFLHFDGNSAPYLQYTYARARSVVRKGEWNGSPTDALETENFTGHERDLVNTLIQFPRVLEEARMEYMPHILAQYLFLLCQRFNAFYNSDAILRSSPIERERRLFLTSSTASLLKTGGELLCLRFPESM